MYYEPFYRKFWTTNNRGNLKVHSYLLLQMLNSFGFGLFQTDQWRTSKMVLFRKNGVVLETHNANTVKRCVCEFLENMSEDEFNKTFGTQQGTQLKVLCLWQDYRLTKNILNSLDIWSKSGPDRGGYEETKKINFFKWDC
jgi:hypothetical protein